MDLIHLDFDRLEDAGRSFLSFAIPQASACIKDYVNNRAHTISVLDKELRAIIIKYFCSGLLGFKHSRFPLQRVGQEPECIERRRKIDFAFEEARCFTHARTHAWTNERTSGNSDDDVANVASVQRRCKVTVNAADLGRLIQVQSTQNYQRFTMTTHFHVDILSLLNDVDLSFLVSLDNDASVTTTERHISTSSSTSLSDALSPNFSDQRSPSAW